MALTTEQTVRIFAMYIGQQCSYPNSHSKKPTVAKLTGVSLNEGLETTYKRRKRNPGGHHGYTSGDLLSFTSNGDHDVDALHTQLILKSTLSITDEERREVGDLRGYAMDYQYLTQKGYAVPLFIAPNHPDNGKTAIELGLAITSSSVKGILEGDKKEVL